jgi:hypothetical protein
LSALHAVRAQKDSCTRNGFGFDAPGARERRRQLTKFAVIHQRYEYQHSRSRVRSLGSRSSRAHRRARRPGARGNRLRRVQALLRREIPDGDPGAIFDRALTLLLEKVEKTKLGAATKPRARRPIRLGTDRQGWKRVLASRYTPRHVKRAVWQRDDGQCAFVSPDGVRCTERTFLEFHHMQAYAHGGPATVENISLRCRRHNQYEAELVFGARAIHPGRPTQPTAAARGATAATDV